MKDEDIRLGQRIKDIRLGKNIYNKKYDQREFAKMIDSTVQALSNWENGRNKPNDIRLQAIAKISDISENELLFGNLKEYLDNIIFNSPSVLEYSTDKFNEFYDYLIENTNDKNYLYLSENEAVERYNRFLEQHNKEGHAIPLGFNIYSAIENIDNLKVVKLFLNEASNEYSLYFGMSPEEAHHRYNNQK